MGQLGQRLWAQHSFTSESLGGKPDSGGPEELRTGYCCPTCERALDAVGSVGPTALTVAVRAFLAVPRTARNQPILVGLVGWAAQSPRPAPSLIPWAFLNEDLTEARKLLRAD